MNTHVQTHVFILSMRRWYSTLTCCAGVEREDPQADVICQRRSSASCTYIHT